MTVFKKLNILEMIISLIIFGLSLVPKRSRLFIATSVILVIIAQSYYFYLTPKIQILTEWWKEAESLGLISIHGVADIQQEHQKFHRLYVSIDSTKLLLLTMSLGFLIFKREPDHA